MTPAQMAADIKRLDKEIAKADEGIRASRDLYEPDLSAHRAGWHRSRVVGARDGLCCVPHSCEGSLGPVCGTTASPDRV
jgi:hypothetical protein